MKFYLKDYLKEINPDKNILISLSVELTKTKSQMVVLDAKVTDKELLKYYNYQVLSRRVDTNYGISFIYTLREPSKIVIPKKTVTKIDDDLVMKLVYKGKDGKYRPKHGFETPTTREIEPSSRRDNGIIKHMKTSKYFHSLSIIQIKKLNEIVNA